MIRCFIGLFVSDVLKNKIIDLQDKIKKLPVKAKFVEPENLHMCLSFLGEVEDERIEEISKNLDSIANEFKRFEVELSGIKIIPSENYIRVLALDVLDKEKNLEKITKEIKNKIGGNIKPTHLTLCRVKSVLDKKGFIEKIKKIDSKIGKLIVPSILLIKSTLQKPGPVYSVLHESVLR